MDKFLTKENIVIVIAVLWVIIQSNYFATKLDISNLEKQVLKLKAELKEYSDTADKAILKEIDTKYDKIMLKLDKLR